MAWHHSNMVPVILNVRTARWLCREGVKPFPVEHWISGAVRQWSWSHSESLCPRGPTPTLQVQTATGSLYSCSVSVWETGSSLLSHALYCSLGMLLMGFLLRNIPVITDQVFIDFKWSASLRNIALAIILARAGLGLDPTVCHTLHYYISTLKWFSKDHFCVCASHFLQLVNCYCVMKYFYLSQVFLYQSVHHHDTC